MATEHVHSDDHQHNQIARIERDDTATSAHFLVYTITNTSGNATECFCPITCVGDKKEVEKVVRSMKDVVCPYPNLRSSLATLATVMEFCEQLPGMNTHEHSFLKPVRLTYNSACERLDRAEKASMAVTSSRETLKKFEYIREADVQFKQAAGILKDFLARERLSSQNICPKEDRDKVVRHVNQALLGFGVVAVMFDNRLFI